MKFPKDSIKTGRALFRASFVDGVMDPAKVRHIAQSLITEKPRNYITTLRYLQKLVRLETQNRRVTVESASPLDVQQQRNLLSSLEQKYGAGLSADFKINPDLIGGTSVRVGYDVFDGSVRGRLNRLKESFAS